MFIVIVCKKWWDRKNGNTYFKTYSYSPSFGEGKEVIETPDNRKMELGYGDHFKYVTLSHLSAKGLIPEWKNEVPWEYCEKHGIVMHTQEVYVSAQKEL